MNQNQIKRIYEKYANRVHEKYANMDQSKIEQQLSEILPNRPKMPGLDGPDRNELVKNEAATIKNKQDAKELARIKFLEKQRLKRAEEKAQRMQSLAEELGLEEPIGNTEHQMREIAEQRKRVEAIEAIEAQTVKPLDPANMTDGAIVGASPSTVMSAVRLQGATRADMTKLLTSLNINLSVQLTKQDTANLLACLLTCNHSQLQALMNNKKVPIVIKTVIKRLIEDEKLGNIDTIERLWDRIFGKGPMQLNLPETQQLETGIIPNTPISREAYIVIRDTLMK